ncbi:MAG: helix-turn-helix transcriptional regulator [Bacteroidetes bacterium]|nr:helix-turn-helix transcriptional regulator [Bacteroidota bacterium]
MSYFSTNLKALRKARGLTQEGLSRKLSIKRAVIGSYEEGRA